MPGKKSRFDENQFYILICANIREITELEFIINIDLATKFSVVKTNGPPFLFKKDPVLTMVCFFKN